MVHLRQMPHSATNTRGIAGMGGRFSAALLFVDHTPHATYLTAILSGNTKRSASSRTLPCPTATNRVTVLGS